MRRLVDVLRPLDDEDRDDNDSGLGPPPGLDDLHGLCDRLRAAGLPLHLDLDVVAPPPRTAVTAYRIVQEALTNVVKHAGQAPTRVQVRGDERLLDLRVTNGPPSGSLSPGRAATAWTGYAAAAHCSAARSSPSHPVAGTLCAPRFSSRRDHDPRPHRRRPAAHAPGIRHDPWRAARHHRRWRSRHRHPRRGTSP